MAKTDETEGLAVVVGTQYLPKRSPDDMASSHLSLHCPPLPPFSRLGLEGKPLHPDFQVSRSPIGEVTGGQVRQWL